MSDAERATTALLELMARLRDPVSGCPWDREQTFATIAPFTLEEAYEVADAIERGDPAQLRDELGDLLFQIVFHSRLAQERGWFDFAAVAMAIHDKLVRRHPHVYAGAAVDGAPAVSLAWEEIKARERADAASAAVAATGAGPRTAGGVATAPDTSALANIAKALPALTRAAKIGRRVARVGFDWQETAQVRDKVIEELAEVDEAIAAKGAAEASGSVATDSHVAEEIGDLLFAIANWTLHLKIDPEEALRAANAKFERRFRQMESFAAASGAELKSLSPQQWEELWGRAKKEEPGRS